MSNKVKDVDIRNLTYYFVDIIDIMNIKIFDSNDTK